MQEMSLIKKKILQYIDTLGVSKYQFYKNTGITRGVLDKQGGISEENLTKFIAHYPEISLLWLLTGEGSMLNENSGVEQKFSGDQGNFKELAEARLIAIEGLSFKVEVLEKKIKDLNDGNPKLTLYDAVAEPKPELSGEKR